MRKKLLITILTVLCALSCALGLSACGNTKKPTTHTHNYQWVNNGDGTHKQHCSSEGCNEPDVNSGSHTWGANGKCDKCSAEKPADGHTHNYQWVNNGDGTHKQHCSNEGCNEPDVNSGSHTWGANGKCDKCSAEKPADGHTHNYQWVNNGDGTHKQHCSNEGCNESDVNSGSHTWGANGKCDKCGAEKPNDHTHNYKWVDNYDGTHQQKCRNEGCDEPVVNKASHTYVGSVCDKCYSVEPPQGHVHDYQWKDDRNNSHSLYCQNEGCNYDHIGSSAEDHIWGTNGICTKCTAVNLQLHTHNWSTEAYCQADLNHLQICDSCNYSKTSEHNFVNKVCTLCGHKKTRGSFTFTLNEDGESYSVKPQKMWGGKYNQNDTEIVIPCTYMGKPVTVVSEEAFKDNNYITSVEIPGCRLLDPSPITVEVGAFSGCQKLKKVVLPQAVAEIGASAFYGCKAMEEITVPYVGKKGAEISHLDDANFGFIFGAGSYRGSSDYIPSTLKNIVVTGGTFIAPYAFSGCSGAESITLPNGLTAIGNRAFPGSLKTINIPNTVTSIGESAFKGSKITSISIPDGVQTIETSVFQDCSELAEITIGSGVKSLAADAFKNCAQLGKVYYNGELENWCCIDGLEEVTDSYPALYINQELLSGVVAIPSTLSKINNYAFHVRSEITEIVIHAGVNDIGTNAFGGCSKLKSITVEDNNAVYASHDGILYNKAKTDCLLVPSAIEGEITIPNGVTRINFYGKKITSIVLPDSITSITENAFMGCDMLETVNIPDTVKNIGISAFERCTSLKTIIIPDGVTTIGDMAFLDCTMLANITVPDSVVSIGSDAFHNTAWYNSKPNGFVYVGKVAYKYKGVMSANKSITLADGTKGIANMAFARETNLLSIYIPDSITYIGIKAFALCENLSLIEFKGTKAQWESIVAQNYAWDLDLPIPYTVGCSDGVIVKNQAT